MPTVAPFYIDLRRTLRKAGIRSMLECQHFDGWNPLFRHRPHAGIRKHPTVLPIEASFATPKHGRCRDWGVRLYLRFLNPVVLTAGMTRGRRAKQQKALRGGILDPYLEPLTRTWSHFVGIYRQKLTKYS